MQNIVEIFNNKVCYDNGLEVYQKELDGYYIDYISGESNTLVITFEPVMADNILLNSKREAWGLNFLYKEGFSVLGVKSKKLDWFRGKELHTFFRSEVISSFFSSFEKVVFYGGSMGGFGCLTFSDACPGAIVIAMGPQSTLSNALVSWEKRFPLALEQDWSGDFIDGKVGASKAKKVYAIYDPYVLPDRKHIERLDPHNLIKLPLHFMGHRIPAALLRMGVLKQVVLQAINEELDTKNFKEISKYKRLLPQYYTALTRQSKSTKVKSFAIEKALMLSAKTLRDRYYVEALDELLKLSITTNNHTDAIVTANLLEFSPQIPRNVAIFIRICEYYLSTGDLKKARLFLNTLEPEHILRVSNKQKKNILSIARQCGSKLTVRIKEAQRDQ